jgi:hypothetical protein
MRHSAWIIRAIQGDKTWYWQAWTGASVAGRPKWVEKFNTHCLYQTRMALEKMVKNGSAHFVRKQGMEIIEVIISF